MTFLLRCLVLTLASIGVATVVGAALVALAWSRQWWAREHLTAAERADTLLWLRLAPAVAAVAAGTFAGLGLWRFESRETDEVLGWVIRGLASSGALFVALFVSRLIHLHSTTRRLLHGWLDGASRIALPGVRVAAYQINVDFPVVAVIGILRPVLVVDRSVLDACDSEELSAILAHEQGHLQRWDNLRRALFTAAPDLLAWTPIGPGLGEAWRAATEEAADDVAAEGSETARLNLATALVRVARLAPTTPHGEARPAFTGTQLPASALYRGESVEHRVRRLCQSPSANPRPSSRRWLLYAATALVVSAVVVQRDIHEVMELIVASLP